MPVVVPGAVSGRKYVAAAPFAPHRFGLLSVVDQPPVSDVHWRGGVEMQPNPCDEAGTTLDGCPTTSAAPKEATSDGFPPNGANPFTVFAQIPCSPVGIWPELQARTVSALRNGEGRAVERVLWTGSVSVSGAGTVNPHLAEDTAIIDGSGVCIQTAATVVVTGAPGTVRAVGLLECALAECYGGEGVLHVPAAAVAHLADHNQLIRDGDRLRTWMGNRVAVYSSNNREGPTGVAPADGSWWFYATGAISLRRSEIEEASTVTEAFDRGNNTSLYIAERTYVINWDCCCHLAVQVTPN